MIGATLLAYRYEGLRSSDMLRLLRSLRNEMSAESGPYAQRRACRLFTAWLRLNGATVRGFKKPPTPELALAQTRLDVAQVCVIALSFTHAPHLVLCKSSFFDIEKGVPLVPDDVPKAQPAAHQPDDYFDEMWPLWLIDLSDDAQVLRVHALLAFSSPVIHLSLIHI